jgi:hypothetical protein
VNIARVHADDELAILLADRRVPRFSGLRQMHPGHLLYAMAALSSTDESPRKTAPVRRVGAPTPRSIA